MVRKCLHSNNDDDNNDGNDNDDATTTVIISLAIKEWDRNGLPTKSPIVEADTV